MSQKIVIPKGLIDPNETTIIEIPEEVQSVETIIAKPMCVASYPAEECSIREYLNPSVCDDSDRGHRYHTEFYNHPYTESIRTPNEHNIKYIQEEIEEYCDEHGQLLGDYDDDDFEEVVKVDPPLLRNKLSIYTPLPTMSYPEFHYQMQPPWKTSFVDLELDLNHPHISTSTFRKPRNISSTDLLNILDAMDKVEFVKLQKNLKDFQTARRKLLYETTNLNTIGDISATLASL